MTDKELIDKWLANGNKITKGKTKWAKGVISGGWNCTKGRAKKNCNYNFARPCGVRTMNFESVYNAPATHVNGAKVFVGSEGTNYASEVN